MVSSFNAHPRKYQCKALVKKLIESILILSVNPRFTFSSLFFICELNRKILSIAFYVKINVGGFLMKIIPILQKMTHEKEGIFFSYNYIFYELTVRCGRPETSRVSFFASNLILFSCVSFLWIILFFQRLDFFYVSECAGKWKYVFFSMSR